MRTLLSLAGLVALAGGARAEPIPWSYSTTILRNYYPGDEVYLGSYTFHEDRGGMATTLYGYAPYPEGVTGGGVSGDRVPLTSVKRYAGELRADAPVPDQWGNPMGNLFDIEWTLTDTASGLSHSEGMAGLYDFVTNAPYENISTPDLTVGLHPEYAPRPDDPILFDLGRNHYSVLFGEQWNDGETSFVGFRVTATALPGPTPPDPGVPGSPSVPEPSVGLLSLIGAGVVAARRRFTTRGDASR